MHEASWTNPALGKRETESLNNIYRGAVITVFLFKTLSLVQKHLLADHINIWGFPGGSAVKNPPATQALQEIRIHLGRPPSGGQGNPLQFSCLENPHGQRSLAGYSP